MKRIKTIDVLRGTSILYMLVGHLLEWWIIPADFWAYVLLRILFEPIGSSAFIFISGVSTSISYRKRMRVADPLNIGELKKIKHEYLFRGFLLFLIGIIYNLVVALAIDTLYDTWKYFVLVTIGLALMISWPLLKTSKLFRCTLGIAIWASDYFILGFLMPFQGQSNVYGILFHFLFNSLDVDPLLFFFTFFIVGTVIGDILDESLKEDRATMNETYIKNKLLLPSLLSGSILIVFGTLFQFPTFLQHRTFPWFFYAMGVILIGFSSLLTLEIYHKIYKKQKKGILFYFSYYSLTLYLGHNVLFFLFPEQLNFVNYLLITSIIVILLGIALKYAYQKVGNKISLKYLINVMSSELAKFTVQLSIKNVVSTTMDGKAQKAKIITKLHDQRK